EVNRFAEGHRLAWFENTVITTVPACYPGAFRRVYPGFLQLAGFLSMNLDRHVSAHWRMFQQLVEGQSDSAAATRAFSDDYSPVAAITAASTAAAGRTTPTPRSATSSARTAKTNVPATCYYRLLADVLSNASAADPLVISCRLRFPLERDPFRLKHSLSL